MLESAMFALATGRQPEPCPFEAPASVLSGSLMGSEYADRWMNLKNQLTTISAYTDDWDGDGALRPASEVIESCLRFCEFGMQKISDAPASRVWATKDGGVTFEWDFENGTRCEAEVSPGQRCEMFISAPGKETEYREIEWAF